MSAILSRVSPNFVQVLVFLAIYPSKISLTIHKLYTIKNNIDNGLRKTIYIAPIILVIVIILGIYLNFILIPPCMHMPAHFII